MDIFIRRLPNAITRLDLMQFISDALKPRWYRLQFNPPGKLTHCEICRIQDINSNRVEYHGIAQVEPPTAGLQVINRLNGELFKNKQVEVRKFFRRSTKRDRRDQPVQILTHPLFDNRRQDRRRPSIRIEFLHAGTTAEQDFPGISAAKSR